MQPAAALPFANVAAAEASIARGAVSGAGASARSEPSGCLELSTNLCPTPAALPATCPACRSGPLRRGSTACAPPGCWRRAWSSLWSRVGARDCSKQLVVICGGGAWHPVSGVCWLLPSRLSAPHTLQLAVHRNCCGRPPAGCYFSPALLEPAFKDPQLSGFLCEARLRHFLVRCNSVCCVPKRFGASLCRACASQRRARKHSTLSGQPCALAPALPPPCPLPTGLWRCAHRRRCGGDRQRCAQLHCFTLCAQYRCCMSCDSCMRVLARCTPAVLTPNWSPAGAETLCDVPRTVEEIEAVMAGGPWPPAGKQQ